MKYPWISLSIIAIWILAGLLVNARPQSSPEVVLLIIAIGTVVLAWVGFRSPVK